MAGKNTHREKDNVCGKDTLCGMFPDLRSANRNGSMDLAFKERLGRGQLLKIDLNPLYEKYDAEKNLIKKRRLINRLSVIQKQGEAHVSFCHPY